jgi:hypothetical protein
MRADAIATFRPDARVCDPHMRDLGTHLHLADPALARKRGGARIHESAQMRTRNVFTPRMFGPTRAAAPTLVF